MKSTVTAKVKIRKDERLIETMKVYSKALQFTIDRCWGSNISFRKELHDETYYEIREEFGLQADLTTHVISQAWEMVKNDPETKPEPQKFATIRYNFPRTVTMKKEWEELSIATIEGRIRVKFEVPECYEKYLDREVCESNLVLKDEELYFYLTLAKEVDVEPFSRDGGRVLGIDLGVNKVAVTSDGDFFGSDVKGKRIEWERQQAELQRKDTPSAIERLKSMSGGWKRFQRWRNHNISKEIVDKLEEGDVIVMEDLTGIRKSAKYNEWVHKWAFRQLRDFIEYKATKKGIQVVYINPKNTSKRCGKCGSLNTTRHGGFFECNNCGFSLDADLNAARNMARSYTETMGLRVPCRCAHDTRCGEAETFFGWTDAERTRKLRASV